MVTALRPLTATYESGVVSRFHRDAVDPGIGYQMGWADVDDFRFMDGDTAATLTEQTGLTLGSGVRLPGGTTLDVAYQLIEAATLDTRSDRSTTRRRWPDVRASLPALTLPQRTGIQRVSLSSGYVKNARETVFGGRGTQRRVQDDVQVPLDLSITWRGSLVTSYRGSFREGEARDPTGDTDRTQSSHRVSVASQFLPPGSLAARLDRPVRFALLVSYVAERDCRTTAARGGCVPFVDQIRRSLSLNIDTSVGGFEVGLLMSYDDRQSFVGQRTGSTQFQLGLFGELQFSAGMLPRVRGR
jgi:hypothetical protein